MTIQLQSLTLRPGAPKVVLTREQDYRTIELLECGVVRCANPGARPRFYGEFVSADGLEFEPTEPTKERKPQR